MEAVEMQELKVGWWGLFDAIYGPEEVLEITIYALGPNQRNAQVYGTSNSGGTWPVIRFRVSDGRGENLYGRFIMRFPHEPVMTMEFPERCPHKADLKIAGTEQSGYLTEADKAVGTDGK